MRPREAKTLWDAYRRWLARRMQTVHIRCSSWQGLIRHPFRTLNRRSGRPPPGHGMDAGSTAMTTPEGKAARPGTLTNPGSRKTRVTTSLCARDRVAPLDSFDADAPRVPHREGQKAETIWPRYQYGRVIRVPCRWVRCRAGEGLAVRRREVVLTGATSPPGETTPANEAFAPRAILQHVPPCRVFASPPSIPRSGRRAMRASREERLMRTAPSLHRETT